MDIAYEKHVLDNGLRVVLHQDRSNPSVAVYVYYHVGSAREDPERSGFAHLFEHMLFQGSQHAAEGLHFKLIQEAGGSLNGTTNQDRTNYYETLPSHHLELALWLEADRMGFLLPALTQAKLDNQRDVVMNERRQSYENRPYGLVHETVLAQLYPAGHPYSWPTIGSMEHIERATLEDVTAFFQRFYGPNNATLVIAGDFESARALDLVQRWFASIPSGPWVDSLAPRPSPLDASCAVTIEDDVHQAQLSLVWPTVEAWHPDEPALNLLTDYLSANRSSVFDRALMIEEALASHVTIHHGPGELAGSLWLNLRPHAGVSLERLEQRIDELVARVAGGEVDARRLQRLEARSEGQRVRSLESESARAALLGHYECFYRRPGLLVDDVERHRRVSAEDVVRVARRYLLDRPRVALSCLPRGQSELAPTSRAMGQRTAWTEPARSSQPEPGRPAPFQVPAVERARLGVPDASNPGVPGASGVDGSGGPELLTTVFDRLPLVRISVAADAGRLQEPDELAGLATLCAEMLEEGTRRCDGNELADELDGLGATLDVAATDDELYITFFTLEEHVERAVGLLGEILLEPRFAAADLERLKRQRQVQLAERRDKNALLAGDLFARALFGPNHPKGRPLAGLPATVEAITSDDVRGFWQARALPATTRIAVAGPGDVSGWSRALGPLVEGWQASARKAARSGPTASPAKDSPGGAPVPREGRLFLCDRPGAPQSELRVGHAGVARDDPDFFPLHVLNYVVGGSFSSRINLNLREDKGWTYGARSAFGGGRTPGRFVVSTAVQTQHSAPALVEILAELQGIRSGVRDEETEFARSAIRQTLAHAYESLDARLNYLDQLAKYRFQPDYPLARMEWLRAMTTADLDALARRYVRPDEALVVVVGDAAELRGPLSELGLGAPIELDREGERR